MADHFKKLLTTFSINSLICRKKSISKRTFFSRYLTEHKRLTLDKAPNYDFLGHPINAYHFVRHVGNGWAKIRDDLAAANIDRNETTEWDVLFDREKEKLPSLHDVQGAAYGMVRLVNLYRLNLTSFIREGIIDTTLDNGQVVYSRPSVVKPICKFSKKL